MKYTKLNMAFAACLLGAAWAHAETIVYTDQVTATGSLGTNTFTNALVTVSFFGDTANVGALGGGFFENAVGTTRVNVAGLGAATFIGDTFDAFDNETFFPPAAGIGDATMGTSILDTFSDVFASYNLGSPIGPVSGTPFIRPDITFLTSLGEFNISSVTGNSVFTATSAPEPGSFTFLVIGMLMVLIGYRLRSWRHMRS